MPFRNTQFLLPVLLPVMAMLPIPAIAQNTVSVSVGNIAQQTSGSSVTSEINIGASSSDRTSALDIHVSVGDVTANTQGTGNKSSINIGSAKGADTSGFKAKVIIGGEVILDTENNDGEINIASQIDRSN